MRYAEEPATQVRSRSSMGQVLEEREECLLQDILAVLRGQSERPHIQKQPPMKLVKELDDQSIRREFLRANLGNSIARQTQGCSDLFRLQG